MVPTGARCPSNTDLAVAPIGTSRQLQHWPYPDNDNNVSLLCECFDRLINVIRYYLKSKPELLAVPLSLGTLTGCPGHIDTVTVIWYEADPAVLRRRQVDDAEQYLILWLSITMSRFRMNPLLSRSVHE